jgi:hypothetical protein
VDRRVGEGFDGSEVEVRGERGHRGVDVVLGDPAFAGVPVLGVALPAVGAFFDPLPVGPAEESGIEVAAGFIAGVRSRLRGSILSAMRIIFARMGISASPRVWSRTAARASESVTLKRASRTAAATGPWSRTGSASSASSIVTPDLRAMARSSGGGVARKRSWPQVASSTRAGSTS